MEYYLKISVCSLNITYLTIEDEGGSFQIIAIYNMGNGGGGVLRETKQTCEHGSW